MNTNNTNLNFNVDLSGFDPAKLSTSALITNMSISVWTGRKLDKRVSEEVDQSKSAKTRAGNYNKNLFAGAAQLEAVTKVAGAARSWMYGVTQPWGDNGDRILSVQSLPQFKQRLMEYEAQFAKAVNIFLDDYDTLVSQAAFQLGDLFDREDYPTREGVVRKFGFRYSVAPMPQAGDFRVDIGEEGLRELREKYETTMRDRIEGAMREAWDRLHDCLTRMSERLADTTDENGDIKRKIFRDSLIENAVEICGLLRTFNITGDTRMDEMRRQLEETLNGVDATMLRESDYVRHQTKAKVDAILDRFAL